MEEKEMILSNLGKLSVKINDLKRVLSQAEHDWVQLRIKLGELEEKVNNNVSDG